MHNKSYYSNATSHDNTFNFKNEIDISNGKKDKTGEMFYKEAYGFDDFNNIGDDKTVKSSNYKGRNVNVSNILKKQFDQYSNHLIGNSILDNEFTNTGFNHLRLNVQGSNRKIHYENEEYPNLNDKNNGRKLSGSQKFKIQQTFQQKNNYKAEENNVNFRNSDLSYTRSNVEAQDPSAIREQSKNQGLQVNSRVVKIQQIQNFRKKDAVFHQEQNRQNQMLNKQAEYRDMISMINFYKDETDKMSYERMILEDESIQELINMANSQSIEEQMRNYLGQINSLNHQIDKQRAIQKKVTRVVSELEEQYNQIVQSVDQMDFRRPVVIKDEAKVLIDQINQLKSQFQVLQRDAGSLNLSCTVFGNPLNSIQNRLSGSHTKPFKQTQEQNQNEQAQEQNYLLKILQQIHEQNSVSQDSHFLKNLKLACIKDEWTIFSNKQLIISIDYKTCPIIKLRIGNKTNQLLKKFSIEIQVRNTCVKLMQNQVLNKKSFLLQGIKIDPQNLAQVFVKVNLSYQIQSQNNSEKQVKDIRLFCPTGILNFGQFTPLTFKQFETELNLPLPHIQSPLRPIDKNLINHIDEIMLYLPNLNKIQGQQSIIYGLFMSVFNQGTLLLVEQHSDLLKIKLKNGNRPLLRLLEFILTV